MHIRRVLAHVLMVVLGSAFRVVAFVCFLVFPLPPLPIQGSKSLPSIVLSIELTVQCDGCLIWGLGWWVGQAYGVFHRPGFGLLVSVCRSLSTQPPFVTQALIKSTWDSNDILIIIIIINAMMNNSGIDQVTTYC